MSKLFNVAESNITYHLQNIFKSGELYKDSITQKIRIIASDGKNYNTSFYSLDVIKAVGYRVNSKETTSFRIWATNTLKEYIKKGFILNNELLKNVGKISHEIATDKALSEFEKYRVTQDTLFESDFDKFILDANTK